MGGFCPGGFCPRRDFVWGILSRGFCPGGFCLRTSVKLAQNVNGKTENVIYFAQCKNVTRRTVM